MLADCGIMSEETGTEEVDKNVGVETGVYKTVLNLKLSCC